MLQHFDIQTIRSIEDFYIDDDFAPSGGADGHNNALAANIELVADTSDHMFDENSDNDGEPELAALVEANREDGGEME